MATDMDAGGMGRPGMTAEFVMFEHRISAFLFGRCQTTLDGVGDGLNEMDHRFANHGDHH